MIARRGLLIGAAAGVVAWSQDAQSQTVAHVALHGILMKLELESWQFLKDRNVAAMRDYLADDAVLIFANGTRYTKAEFLKMIPDFRLESFAIEPGAKVEMWTREVATLQYRITHSRAMKDAKATSTKALSSSTYVRRHGKWLSALYQETKI